MAKVASETRRAQQLLLEALRAPEKLPGLPPADWDLLLRVARRARVLGRLESDLARAGLLGDIPARAAAHLRAARNVIAHRNTLISWEVNRLLWALKGIDVPLILLKGSAYLLAALPPARGRIFADVDLLVPEERIGEIEERLVERGWFKTQIDPYDDRYYRVWMHEIPPLRHRERGTEIDIHHRLLPKTSHLKSDPEPLFAAARPLADPRLRILAPADMVLHALVHLFLEGDPDEGLRLRDLVDVHDLLCHFGQEPGFWVGLGPRARALGFERPLYYGLHHAQRLFGYADSTGCAARIGRCSACLADPRVHESSDPPRASTGTPGSSFPVGGCRPLADLCTCPLVADAVLDCSPNTCRTRHGYGFADFANGSTWPSST